MVQARKFRVRGKRLAWATQFKATMLKGAPLNPPMMIAQRYSDRLTRHIDTMLAETMREMERLAAAFDVTFDDNIGPQARIVANALRDKFDALFAKVAKPAAEQMAESTNKDNESKAARSLREMSGQVSLKTDVLHEGLADVLAATVAENVSLIKRIPAKYLDDVQGAVMRSIQSGNGMADLRPALEKYGVQIRNWAHNVAMDQTRKANAGISAARIQALGVEEFEWMHSGGSNHPREYHRDVLNGKIFRFDDPPHLIGPNTGEKGLPGQLPYCFPGWVQLHHSSRIDKFFRRAYRGVLTQLITDDGGILESTLNHQILTLDGWQASESIDVGQYIVGASNQRVSTIETHIDDRHTRFDDAFNALATAFGSRFAVPSATFEFDRDGADFEVDIVDIARPLTFEYDATFAKHFCELIFAISDDCLRDARVSVRGFALQSFFGIDRSPPSIMRGFDAALTLFGGHLPHAHDIRKRAIAQICAAIDKSIRHYSAAYAESFAKFKDAHASAIESDQFTHVDILSIWRHANNARYFKAVSAERFGEVVGMNCEQRSDFFEAARLIEKPTRVVEKRFREFSGFVHNVETEGHWYVANGLIVHNCRCKMRPVYRFDDKDE